MKTLFLLGVLAFLSHASKGASKAKEFRFDYEFNEQAPGWLKYHAVPATWDEARMRCHAEGAILASPLTDQLKKAIVSFVKKQTKSDNEAGITIFSGVHATFSKGDYSSIEGVPLLRLAVTWAPGEPDNYNNSESCLVMRINTNGTMADGRCGDVLPYVCYKKDTCVHAINSACGTIDFEYSMYRTGSCYKFHSSGLPWSQAYMTCVAEGGYLAVINDYVELAVVTEIFSKYPDNTIFTSKYTGSLALGFHDWGQYGRSFMTIHGETLNSTYIIWGAGAPDNLTLERSGDMGQYCGSVLRNGQMDDMWCNVPLAFLCEKDPKSLLPLKFEVKD